MFNFGIIQKHVADLQTGDIAFHEGLFRTVGRNHLSRCNFMGHCYRGDSFNLGTLPVYCINLDVFEKLRRK